MLPRFKVYEVWGSDGDVQVSFEDSMTSDLHDRVQSEIESKAEALDEDERTIYHLERVVGGIFSTMAVGGRLGKRNGQWTIKEDVRHEATRNNSGF